MSAAMVGAAGLGAVAAIGRLPAAEAVGANAGAATVFTPAGDPLTTGGSATPFTLRLPPGAACAGDSANANYRIQSYMVPASVDPGTLTFGSQGPTPVAGQFRAPLYDTFGSPYVNRQTANAVPAGGPGLIIQPLPAFNYAVYDPATFPIPPGTYNIGIACTLGPASATQQEKYFNVQKVFVADPADPGPAKIRWTVASSTPPTTTPTTGPSTTTPTTGPSTTTPTTGPSTTTPTTGPSTTTPTTSPSTTTPSTAPPPQPSESQYVMVANDGGVFAPGGRGFYGSASLRPGDGILRDSRGRIVGASGSPLDSPVVAMAYTPTRQGYWLVQADGGVLHRGDAANLGDLKTVGLQSPIVGSVATKDGRGLYAVAADGGIFSLGNAPFKGSLGGTRLQKPIVGMALDPDGSGDVLVASDGGVFAFDAAFRGSLGATRLDQPIVGIAVAPGGGYVLAASDGGVFTYGVSFKGSMSGVRMVAPVVGIALDPDGSGYWMAGADGGLFAYDARFFGSVISLLLHAPISGVVAL